MDPKYEHFKNFSSDPMSMEEKRKVWLDISDMTEQEFDAMMAGQKERQVRVPKVGTEAPDFRIERLTRDKKRTGDYVRLSALRGKPVALLFGSFT
jgi:predicted ATPase